MWYASDFVSLSSLLRKMCNYGKTREITKTCPWNIQRFLKLEKLKIFIGKMLVLFKIFAQNTDCGYKLEPFKQVPKIYVLEQKWEKIVVGTS